MGYIENARKYNKPIWITEFASWDYNNPVQNVNDQMKYLAGTVNFLEREPNIFRYSWFIGRTSGGKNTFFRSIAVFGLPACSFVQLDAYPRYL